MPLFADSAELYFSDESIQGQYTTGADLIGLTAGELELDLFTNEADDLLGAVALNFAGRPAGVSPWVFSAGPKLYAATLDFWGDHFTALAVGARAAYTLPPMLPLPAQVTGQFNYAPKITTFGEAEDLMDLILRFEMEFMQRVNGFIGYRLLEPDLEDDSDYELDHHVHLGVRFNF
jgi:hypothetical protein